MKIKTWHEGMSQDEAKDLAYWERNMLALRYADGWYYDLEDAVLVGPDGDAFDGVKPRYVGWTRVLSLEGGKITFHIPDHFDVGNLSEIQQNWDGHTSEEKWQRILADRGIGS